MPTPINISASRGAAILGLSKWSTPTEVWLKIMEAREPGFCAKNNYLFPVDEDSAPFRWGRAFESSIVELASEKAGHEIKGREQLWSYNPISCGRITDVPGDSIKNYITCHIDGYYHEGDGIRGSLHEGKTTQIFYYNDNFGEPGTDRVPMEYQIQCQHQMICTSAEKVILSVLVFPKRQDEFEEMGWEIRKQGEKYWLYNDGEGGKYYEIPPTDWAESLDQMGYFHQYVINANPELQALMITAYTSFWNEHILTATPPDPKSYDDIRALIREPKGTIIATEEIERLQSEYKQIKSEISGTGPLAKRAEQIKVDLIDYINKSGKVIDDDSGDKFILRDRAGKKIGSYGKNKNGVLGFR